MAFNINMDDVNGEIDRLKSLLKEANIRRKRKVKTLSKVVTT